MGDGRNLPEYNEAWMLPGALGGAALHLQRCSIPSHTIMPQQHPVNLVVVTALAWLGLLLAHSYFSTSASDRPPTASSDSSSLAGEGRRSLFASLSEYSDPKSTFPRPPDLFEEDARLADLKYARPTVARKRLDSDRKDVAIDVLSIGSETRPEYFAAQIDTWASHADVRQYWGVTERQDFDPDCPAMNEGDLLSYIRSCQGPMGWQDQAEAFRVKHFGWASGVNISARSRQPGWFCAQRRPGRALGWLRATYQNSTAIPDILLIVDDDTSVDVVKVKKIMMKKIFGPFSGGGCVFDKRYFNQGFPFSYGGFGTFLNRDAIERMTLPIFCDERRSARRPRRGRSARHFVNAVCSNLEKNRVGELNVFKQGDSVFDIFYKYSAQPKFCMHSDWALGYMITFYSGGPLAQANPKRCQKDHCNYLSLTCHEQTPKDMENFVLARSAQGRKNPSILRNPLH